MWSVPSSRVQESCAGLDPACSLPSSAVTQDTWPAVGGTHPSGIQAGLEIPLNLSLACCPHPPHPYFQGQQRYKTDTHTHTLLSVYSEPHTQWTSTQGPSSAHGGSEKSQNSSHSHTATLLSQRMLISRNETYRSWLLSYIHLWGKRHPTCTHAILPGSHLGPRVSMERLEGRL